MSLLRKIVILSIFSTFGGLMFSADGGQALWASTFCLDREAVFCICYALSGEDFSEEDLEDLSFELGRPTFTAHKPAEMFTKGSLTSLRESLSERMQNYHNDSLFHWNMQCTVFPKDGIGKFPKIVLEKSEIPQPTPFIRSEISKKGQSIITRQIQTLIAAQSNVQTKKSVDIIVYLRPEKIDYQYDKRNVAREDIVLPIRYVIFQPVKIKIFDEIVAVEKGLH